MLYAHAAAMPDLEDLDMRAACQHTWHACQQSVQDSYPELAHHSRITDGTTPPDLRICTITPPKWHWQLTTHA